MGNMDSGVEKHIRVEVAYATPDQQLIIAVEVPEGCTALEAVEQSGIAERFDTIDIYQDPMGIFSQPLNGKVLPEPSDYILQPRDRVEIYRPLLIDPKQARLNRAKNKEMTQGKG
jgi:putative ubiquitin-RnfH superfamily antitoxin RatB of RatAB toxin-antitoxin module